MSREKLILELEKYIPFNEQEESDKSLILSELKSNDRIFTRESLNGHMTASAWIINTKRDKVLMAYHNIYNSWAWTGGHADGDEELLKVALKEAAEETGIEHINPLKDDIFSVEIIPVSGHEKRGHYVSSHLHYNLTYLLEAEEEDELFIKPDENSRVGWLPIANLEEYCNEPWIFDRIYKKLVDKMN
ncbi:MAG: NUDIX hydrolase [Eubacteriales bacterium]|nr:NUDIX hydrolase [Eubacteriales bacterium]